MIVAQLATAAGVIACLLLAFFGWQNFQRSEGREKGLLMMALSIIIAANLALLFL